jgi:hypothetical protein
MRSKIMMGCLMMLSIATYAQRNGRVPSGANLKWAMSGGIEIMPGDLRYHYGSPDTLNNNRYNTTTTFNTALGGNPTATRFAGIRTQCDQNAIQLNWVAIQQQFGADRYEIEQSSNGRNWNVIGVVPANRTEFGEASYNFNYNKNVNNVFFRIVAINIGGERVFSSVLDSPCSSNNYLAVTPNPVYSSTTLRIGSPSNAKVRAALLDSKGAMVHTYDIGLSAGINHYPLDMSRFPRGNYTLVLSWINGKQETLSIVKQ